MKPGNSFKECAKDRPEMVVEPGLALNRLADAEDLTEVTQERWAEAEMHRLRGTLLLAVRKSREADSCACG